MKPAFSDLDEDLTTAFHERRRQLRAITARIGADEAEDLLQDAVVRAIESDRKASVRKPLHLLRRILRNLTIDHLRARARTSRLFSPAEAPDIACGGPGADHRMVAGERLRQALAVIKAMPERRRAVFLMHRIEEMTHLQIARRLGISTKTVEKHIGLAMIQLSRGVDRE